MSLILSGDCDIYGPPTVFHFFFIFFYLFIFNIYFLLFIFIFPFFYFYYYYYFQFVDMGNINIDLILMGYHRSATLHVSKLAKAVVNGHGLIAHDVSKPHKAACDKWHERIIGEKTSSSIDQPTIRKCLVKHNLCIEVGNCSVFQTILNYEINGFDL